jgi:hypothetical protein
MLRQPSSQLDADAVGAAPRMCTGRIKHHQEAQHVQAGQRLKGAMRARGWMLADLAKATGLSVRTCCTLQQGQGNVGNYIRSCITLAIPTGLANGNPSGRHLYNAAWAWSAKTFEAEARRFASFITPELTYWTPNPYWRPFWLLRRRIDLDAFSPEDPTVDCLNYFTRWQNGFLHYWYGIVWLNPPYDRASMLELVKKIPAELASGRIELMAALVRNDPSPAWAKMMRDTEATIFHFTDRISFGGTGKNPNFTCVLGVWLATDDELSQLRSTLPANYDVSFKRGAKSS